MRSHIQSPSRCEQVEKSIPDFNMNQPISSKRPGDRARAYPHSENLPFMALRHLPPPEPADILNCESRSGSDHTRWASACWLACTGVCEWSLGHGSTELLVVVRPYSPSRRNEAQAITGNWARS